MAIADDCWLAVGFGVEPDHAREESCLGVDNVFNRLTRNRIREETNEIAGMPRFEGDADLALRLETADAGPVPCTRINNDEWPLALVDLCAIRRQNAHEGVVYRPLQLAPIHDEFAAELQDMRRNLGVMLLVAVAALLKDI